MPAPSRIGILAAFASIYLIWGSTYLAILFAIRSIPPLLMAGARFLVAGAILYAGARLSGAARTTPMEWRIALIVGACLLLGGNGGVTLAEQYVPSGLAALLVATVPLYIALLSWIFGLSERPRPLALVGLGGGFFGVGLLVGPALRAALLDVDSQAWIGMAILLFSSLAWSAGSLYARRAKGAASPFLAAGQQMLCGGTLLVLVGLVRGEGAQLDLNGITFESFAAWIYLVLIGGIIGYVSYAWLIQKCDPAKVATYAYVNPVVAVILGALFAGERLTLLTAVAACVIVGSVALVITAGRRKAVPTPEVACPVEQGKAIS